MAYSYIIYTVANPADNDFVVSFPYIAKEHVKVLVNTTEVSFSWLTNATVEVASALLHVGDSVRVERHTPIQEPLVGYSGGAALTRANLDKSQLQSLYVAQESWDSLTGQLQPDATGNFDARNHRIINVADPVNPQDAVTKVYADLEKVQAAASALAADTARVLSEAARDTSIAAKDDSVAAAANAEVARVGAVAAKDEAVATVANKVDVGVFTAAWDFIVGSGPAAAVKKSASEVFSYLTTLVGAWTRQQYAPPVTVTPNAGAVTLDADLHQNCKITSTVNLTMNAPTNAAAGKMLFVKLFSASALTITWNVVFAKNADKELPAAHTAGKDMFLQFYFDGSEWVLLGGCERA